MENTVERAVLMAEGEEIVPEDIELFFADPESSGSDRSVRLPPDGISLMDAERQLIEQALERSCGVQKEAAKLLGVSCRVLNYKIKHVHGLRNEEGD